MASLPRSRSPDRGPGHSHVDSEMRRSASASPNPSISEGRAKMDNLDPISRHGEGPRGYEKGLSIKRLVGPPKARKLLVKLGMVLATEDWCHVVSILNGKGSHLTTNFVYISNTWQCIHLPHLLNFLQYLDLSSSSNVAQEQRHHKQRLLAEFCGAGYTPLRITWYLNRSVAPRPR